MKDMTKEELKNKKEAENNEWLFIHTRILNRMPITAKERDRYLELERSRPSTAEGKDHET